MKAAVSSGVGGSPVRSSVARRMSVAASASGAKSSPGDLRALHRSEGPERAVGVGEVGAGRELVRFGGAALGAFGDPATQRLELGRGHLLALLGHLAFGYDAMQRASLGTAGDDERLSVLRLPVHEATQPQVDAALGFRLLPVTMRAVLLEDRPDLGVVVRRTRRAQAGRGDEARTEQGDGMAKG